jgi:DNA-binding CsgD family transcriptional regulator
LAIRQGDLESAESYLIEGLIIRQTLEERWGIASILGSLGWVALLKRDFTRMRDLLAESLEIRMAIDDKGGTAWCLEKLAQGIRLKASAFPTNLRRESQKLSVRIFGAATGLRAPIHSVMDQADQPAYEGELNALRNALGDKAFNTAWDEGQNIFLPELVEQGLALFDEQHLETLWSEAQADKALFGGLTTREREVAILISQGQSNQAIADALVVKMKTIETYVTRILNKLGFVSRVQIATWAVTTGLADRANDDPKA